MLLQQLRSEKEFVEKENQQLRDVKQHPEANSAKVTVWFDRERTSQAEVQLSESDDVVAVAAAVSRAHSLDVAEGRALLEQLQRSYLALCTARVWSASRPSSPVAEEASGDILEDAGHAGADAQDLLADEVDRDHERDGDGAEEVEVGDARGGGGVHARSGGARKVFGAP